jgi:hypothetical protein
VYAPAAEVDEERPEEPDADRDHPQQALDPAVDEARSEDQRSTGDG